MDNQLTHKQEEEKMGAFSLFDREGTGLITARQLGAIIRSLGHKPTQAELQNIINEVDIDGKGGIDFPSFMKALDSEGGKSEDDLRQTFRVFDRDGNGFITAVEFHRVALNLGVELTKDEAEKLIRDADICCDGLLSYDDFVSVMEDH